MFGREGTKGNGHADAEMPHATLQPAGAPDAWHLFDLWSHATPPAIARIEDYQASDWESVSHEGVVPRGLPARRYMKAAIDWRVT